MKHVYISRLIRHELVPIILFCTIGLLLSLVAALTLAVDLSSVVGFF
ncbi:hypothetical protein [Bradyrhizobium genosp. P]